MIITILLLLVAFIIILFVGTLTLPIVAEAISDTLDIIEEIKRKRGKRK